MYYIYIELYCILYIYIYILIYIICNIYIILCLSAISMLHSTHIGRCNNILIKAGGLHRVTFINLYIACWSPPEPGKQKLGKSGRHYDFSASSKDLIKIPIRYCCFVMVAFSVSFSK
jgi:hypothetical protein